MMDLQSISPKILRMWPEMTPRSNDCPIKVPQVASWDKRATQFNEYGDRPFRFHGPYFKTDEATDRFLIHLEGNIGAGKSTLGQKLAESSDFDFLEEPVDIWQYAFPENLLDLFYKDAKRWGFMFQLAAFVTRAKTWDEILCRTAAETVILERSIYSDYHVFAKNCYAKSLITTTELEVYTDLWRWLEPKWCNRPNIILYLRTPAEVCYERIVKRGRSEEKGTVPLSYLQELENLHDKWLIGNRKTIIVDGEDVDVDKVKELIGYSGVAYAPPVLNRKGDK